MNVWGHQFDWDLDSNTEFDYMVSLCDSLGFHFLSGSYECNQCSIVVNLGIHMTLLIDEAMIGCIPTLFTFITDNKKLNMKLVGKNI